MWRGDNSEKAAQVALQSLTKRMDDSQLHRRVCNDTSSVTAAASTWDSMWNLGSQTLDKAVTVKLTRTLAIIPITLVLSLLQAKKEGSAKGDFRLKNAFPMFILWFICASVITTICTSFGVPAAVFQPLKELSKFFIIMAMAAIG